MNPRVEQALAGLLSVDELTEDEQEDFFEGFARKMAAPSAEELAFWADRNRRGLGVGLDDAGNLVVPAVVMPAGPTTVQ